MIVTLQEDPDTGEIIIQLPPEMLESLGWDIGDTLAWGVQDNGSIILSKRENTV